MNDGLDGDENSGKASADTGYHVIKPKFCPFIPPST